MGRSCIIQNTFNNSLPTECSYVRYGLRTTDVFPVVASLPPKNNIEGSDDRKYVCCSQAMPGIAMRFTKVFLGADHWTFEWGGGMGDFGIKMISCKLISTKEIPALKKKKRIMLKKKKNKQTNKTKTEKSYKKFYLQRFGEKKSYPNQITHIPLPPLPPLFHPSKVKWSALIQSEFRVMCKLSNKKNKTSCGEKDNNNNNQTFLRANLDLQG